MEFQFSPEEEAFRGEVLEFIAEHITPEVLAEQEEDDDEAGPHTKAMQAKMMERGWVRLAMPKEYGGQGGDLTLQYIVDEEFTRAGVFTGHNYGTGYTVPEDKN